MRETFPGPGPAELRGIPEDQPAGEGRRGAAGHCTTNDEARATASPHHAGLMESRGGRVHALRQAGEQVPKLSGGAAVAVFHDLWIRIRGIMVKPKRMPPGGGK